jgi:hypothetical protein
MIADISPLGNTTQRKLMESQNSQILCSLVESGFTVNLSLTQKPFALVEISRNAKLAIVELSTHFRQALKD